MEDGNNDVSENPLKFIQDHRENFLNSLPPYMRMDIERADIYTDFLVCYLARKPNRSRRVDQHFLDLNKGNVSYKFFMEKQGAVKYGYADIIKESDNYSKLKITDSGLLHYRYLETRYRTKSVTLMHRIIRYVLKLMPVLVFCFCISKQ